ncbi:hypothetical protein E3T26_06875 [Cryobacterium sp. TMT1-21]|uniref:hypothetical protein n=1 Tax=Cryobacterium sp. TMT1-21 TaxID=1259234 RepID=UPI00106A6BFF|nr:hypothetical protein [Cryobacterium sp. TMT1-21]TFD15499.1 hypothetical protein E3T26_06875 [Cryobacterium sp. TMT1-21]
MLISKDHLRALHTVSKDQTRPLLTVIDIKQDGDEIVAASTDGYILTEVRQHAEDADQYPETNGSPSIDNVRITGATAAKLKPMMKPQKLLPVLAYANVTKSGVITTDLEHTTVFNDHQVSGNFPDYKELIPPSDTAIATVKLNPEFLANVLKAFKGIDSVTLELFEGTATPVVIRSNSSDVEVTGVVMPLKSYN